MTDDLPARPGLARAPGAPAETSSSPVSAGVAPPSMATLFITHYRGPGRRLLKCLHRARYRNRTTPDPFTEVVRAGSCPWRKAQAHSDRLRVPRCYRPSSGMLAPASRTFRNGRGRLVQLARATRVDRQPLAPLPHAQHCASRRVALQIRL